MRHSGLTVAHVAVASNAATPLFANITDEAIGTCPKYRAIKNTDAAIVIYVAGSAEDLADLTKGYPLKAGEELVLMGFANEDFGGAVYAKAASGTPTVATIQY